MTKAELIERLQKGAGKKLSLKDAHAIFDQIFDDISYSITRHGRFVVPGFGSFTLKKRAARVGRNPRTDERVEIAARKRIAFREKE